MVDSKTWFVNISLQNSQILRFVGYFIFFPVSMLRMSAGDFLTCHVQYTCIHKKDAVRAFNHGITYILAYKINLMKKANCFICRAFRT